MTTRFGVGGREGHDSSPFYDRALVPVAETTDAEIAAPSVVDEVFCHSAEHMEELPDASVALMVTSPPYHAGKEYDTDASFSDYLSLLERVFRETDRLLQPGGRAVVNVANLGRRPYVPLSHEVTARMREIGFLMRGEIVWRKARGAGRSCAWGSWRSPANPVVRDVHEYCLCFSKGRFDRAATGEADISAEDFMASTLSVWEVPAEHASRARHPAPFPVELPKRFIQLFTYRGELVLDPFMGSGSTAVACVLTGRRWIGYDTSPGYCDVTRRRAAAAEGRLPFGP